MPAVALFAAFTVISLVFDLLTAPRYDRA